LNTRKSELIARLAEFQHEKATLLQLIAAPDVDDCKPIVNNLSSQEEKIVLFRSLFRGREDVYPRRFESVKTGKKGYQPVCRNEWISGICEKPKIRCENCAHREFLPITDIVVRNHLQGFDPQDKSVRDFTIGVYPMLPDETCWFLAVDFDKASWQEDVRAFLKPVRNLMCPPHWSGHVQVMVGIFGYSSPNQFQQFWLVRWGHSYFLKPWSGGRRSGWIPMIDSFPARIHCPEGALEI